MTGIEPLIVAWAIAWVAIRAWETFRSERRHVVAMHAAQIARDHPDWSPGRIDRNARRRAWAWWTEELRHGFPTFLLSLREHREWVRAARAEAHAAGETRIADVRRRAAEARANAARAKAQADGELDPEPEVASPGPVPTASASDPDPAPDAPASQRPDLKVLPGGNQPPAAPERVSPEPAQGAPGTQPTLPVVKPEPWTGDLDPEAYSALEDDLRSSGRCVQPVGQDPEEGVAYCGAPVPDGYLYCLEHLDGGAQPASPGAIPGNPATEGDEDMSLIEEAETPYEGMLATLAQFAGVARNVANQAADDLQAAAVVHGFSRDAATMADLESLADSASALAARAEQARTGMVSRHEAGAEYHEGQDAHASAFRPN